MGRYAVLALALGAACRLDFDPLGGAASDAGGGSDRDASQVAAFHELSAAECAGQCVCTPTAIPFVIPGCTNIAAGAVTAASQALAGEPAAAVDGDACNTEWNAGAFPTQWFEIQLAAPMAVRGLTLVPSSSPLTPVTVHVIELYTDSTLAATRTIDDPLTDSHWYGLDLGIQVIANRVRITTTASTSFVAWREVALLACP